MLAVSRFLLVLFASILVCLLGTVYSLLHFRDPSNVSVVTRWLGRLHHLFGLEMEYRPHPDTPTTPAIYVGNHQNNFDMITISRMVRPRTVSVGKKSLIWIPFFGLLYWASGNIFLDRNNRTKAQGTMNALAKRINKEQLSIWVFPEGTRSRGRGLLPFKTGAFHVSIASGVPIVPVVCSTTHKKVKWNRWHNGKVICEELAPIDTRQFQRENVRELAQYCHDLMEKRIAELDAEIAEQEQKK